MAGLWCAGIPTEDPRPLESAPRAIAIILPYYENPEFLAYQIARWRTWPRELAARCSAIIVDDGSPEPARLPAPEAWPFPLRLFRIEVDIRWNWLAARNIGAHYAPPGWMLITDMDHVLPAETADHLITRTYDPATAYALARRDARGQPLAPHSASFFLTRDRFWRTGGYDERLSGFYGTDGDFRRRLARERIRMLPYPLERHEYEADASTRRYARKQPEDAGKRPIIARRGPGWKPLILSFPYREVLG